LNGCGGALEAVDRFDQSREAVAFFAAAPLAAADGADPRSRRWWWWWGEEEAPTSRTPL
jgi:hypothetical protein